MCFTKMYRHAFWFFSFHPNADNFQDFSSKCKITNYFLTLQVQRCWSDYCFVNAIFSWFIIAMPRTNSLLVFAALFSCCYPIQSVLLLSSLVFCLKYHKTERVQSVQVARQQCSFLSHACTCSQTDPIIGRSVRQIKWFEKFSWEFVFWAWEKWLYCWST